MNKTIDQLTSDYPIADVKRHWNPESEPFTGMDALFHAIRNHWTVSQTVFCEYTINARNRSVRVYTFILSSCDEVRYMAVIESPHVLTFIKRTRLELVTVGEYVPVFTAEPVYVR